MIFNFSTTCQYNHLTDKVFVLLWVMMNSVFHALERTLLQFFEVIQVILALAQNFLATINF